MEKLHIERQPKGFKVEIEGKPHQMVIMLGVMCADICETLKIPPEMLATLLMSSIQDAVMHAEKGKPEK